MLFAQEVENSRELLESTVIPILTGIIEAPRTSPLAEIDIEDTLRFLSAITSVVRESVKYIFYAVNSNVILFV